LYNHFIDVTYNYFLEPLGGCVELRRGVHVGEGAANAAEGAAPPVRGGAGALPGLFLHGRMVLGTCC